MTEDGSARRTEPERARHLGQEPPAVDASTLFGRGREVIILHRGERYRLRVTQSGKLILTK